jgi:transposase
MQASDHSVAKAQVGYALLQGCSWREAVQAAGVQMSRATAYRQRQRLLAGGEADWHDRRQGHATKVRGAVRTWLEGYYQHHPRASGKAVQALLEEQYGVRVSVTHLNRLRAALLGATRAGEKSARDMAGWGWWTPVAGSNPGDNFALDTGGGPADKSRGRHISAARTDHRQDAAAIPVDVALSGGRRPAPPLGSEGIYPGGVSTPHHSTPGVWLSHCRTISYAGRAGGRR